MRVLARVLLSLGVVGTLGASTGHAQEPALPPGSIVVPSSSERGEEALASARREGGARWTLRRVSPPEPRVDEGPALAEALRALRLRFLDSANPGECLASLGAEEFAVARLLVERRRELAAGVEVMRAECTLAAQRPERAREVLEAAYVLELDVDRVLGSTAPDFQAFADEPRSAARQRERVPVVLRALVEGTRFEVDGSPLSCSGGACRARVTAGRHFVRASAPGYEPRLLDRDFDAATELTVALDPALPATASTQLREMLVDEDAWTELASARLASAAFGAPVTLLVRERGDELDALLWDRATDSNLRLSAPLSETTEGELTRQILQEWLHRIGGGGVDPLAVVLISVGTAVAAGVGLSLGIYFATNPTYQLTFAP